MYIFAHAGEEHTTTQEVVTHAANNRGPALVLITVIFVGLIAMAAFLLSKQMSTKPKKED